MIIFDDTIWDLFWKRISQEDNLDHYKQDNSWFPYLCTKLHNHADMGVVVRDSFVWSEMMSMMLLKNLTMKRRIIPKIKYFQTHHKLIDPEYINSCVCNMQRPLSKNDQTFCWRELEIFSKIQKIAHLYGPPEVVTRLELILRPTLRWKRSLKRILQIKNDKAFRKAVCKRLNTKETCPK
jgi:hypothetical protein